MNYFDHSLRIFYIIISLYTWQLQGNQTLTYLYDVFIMSPHINPGQYVEIIIINNKSNSDSSSPCQYKWILPNNTNNIIVKK